MRGQLGYGNRARHSEAVFQQRPIECLAVERNQYRPLCEARRKFVEQGMLFGEIAQKELFDLQATRIPPREAHEKSIGASSAGEPGGLRIEEEPLFGVFEHGASPSTEVYVARL